MSHFLSIILLLICCSLNGQKKNFYNVISPSGDTSYWYKHHTKELKKLSLPSLDTVLNIEYFRVWTDKQVIEIWKNIDGTIAGKLTSWTDEYPPSNEKPTNRTFHNSDILNSDTAQLVRQLIFSSNILNTPSEDSIKEWKQGFDGVIYFFESVYNHRYSFKTYWSPKSQESVKEAILVQKFIDDIFTLTKALVIWKEFSKVIPFECYINGGPSVACKVLSHKERKMYIKDRKKYRRRNSMRL